MGNTPTDEYQINVSESRENSQLCVNTCGLQHKTITSESYTNTHSEQKVDQLKEILSPIQKIPFELLSQIFVLSTEDLREDLVICSNKGRFPRILGPVYAIEQTCVLWRSVAHSTPILWSHIYVPVDIYENCQSIKLANAAHAIQKFIKLSRDVPLTIKFSRNLSSSPVGVITEMPDDLIGSVHRWEIVEGIDTQLMIGIMSTAPKEGLQITERSLSTPRQVHIRSTPHLKRISIAHLESAEISFQEIAQLTHFEITNVSFPRLTFANFPWSQIVHFSSGKNVFYGDEELSSVLTSMTNLMSFNIDHGVRRGLQISLPTVQTLSVCSAEALAPFTTPHLKILRIKCDVMPMTNARSLKRHLMMMQGFAEYMMLQYLERSRCIIEELELSSIRLLGEHFWKYAHLKHIKRINLTSSTNLHADMCTLNRSIGGIEILPQLEVLNIRIHGGGELDTEEIIRMINSRLPDIYYIRGEDNSLKYLKSVTINNVPKDKIESLKVLAPVAFKFNAMV